MNRFLSITGLLFVCHFSLGAQELSNWTAQTAPCLESRELAKHDRMEIGVWMNTSNVALVAEFSRAMDFWANFLDMSWHERNTPDCAIQVVDGSHSLFLSDIIAARAQLVDRKLFYGWIAFNPKCRLSDVEAYLTAIHEIGHTLGLPHNPNPKSVMYFLNPEYPPLLDKSDIAYLRKRHKLRDASAAAAQLARN
ncbi:MAG: matrixin family metalloprotease [Bryobacteraceae bacterium]